MKKVFLIFSLLLVSLLLVSCNISGDNNNNTDETSVDVDVIDLAKTGNNYIVKVHVKSSVSNINDLKEIANDTVRQIYLSITQDVGLSKGTLLVEFYTDSAVTSSLGNLSFNINLNNDTPGLSLISDTLKLA